MESMLYNQCIVYLDDIKCWADSLDEMEDILTKVCEAMTEAGLKLNGEKSCWVSFASVTVYPCTFLCI